MEREPVALCLANRLICERGANRGRPWTCYAQVLFDRFDGGNSWTADCIVREWSRLGRDIEELRTMAIRDIAVIALPDDDEINERTAESKTDSEKKTSVTLPDNDNVTRLAKKLRMCDDPKATMKSVALEFTRGNEKNASNLLRQLRRYKHLLAGTRWERTADN